MKQYLIISLFAMFFMACNDDDGLGATQGERNWFVLEDSDDPIDHQRYEIFTEFNVPVYYNDTIGSELRRGMGGELYTYYERLQVFYNPGGSLVQGRFTLLEDRNSIKPVLDYLQQEMLPAIPRSFYIPSILLVDSLVVGGDSSAYKGLNTVVCGKVREFSEMDDDTKKWWRGSVMRAMIAGGLMSNESEWLEEYFFSQSLAVDPKSECIYSTASRKYMVYVALKNTDIPSTEQNLGVIGFLNIKVKPGKNERYEYVPTKEEDVGQFCEAIFALSAEEFEERWGMYPVVMAKYRAMKEKLKEYNFI